MSPIGALGNAAASENVRSPGWTGSGWPRSKGSEWPGTDLQCWSDVIVGARRLATGSSGESGETPRYYSRWHAPPYLHAASTSRLDRISPDEWRFREAQFSGMVGAIPFTAG